MDPLDKVLQDAAPMTSSTDEGVRREISSLAATTEVPRSRRSGRRVAAGALAATLVVGGAGAAAASAGWIDLFGWQPDRVETLTEDCHLGFVVTPDSEAGTADPGYQAAVQALRGVTAEQIGLGGATDWSVDGAQAEGQHREAVVSVLSLVEDEVASQGLATDTFGIKIGSRCEEE